MKKRVILYSRVAANGLGQLRSFAQCGYQVVIVYVGKALPTELKYSRYTETYYCIPDLKESIEFIISNFGDANNPDGITIDSDGLVAIVDKYYDELKDRFIFFNAGSKGRLSYYMQKHVMCELAKQYGLNVPMTEIVNVGVLPTVVPYPIFTKAQDSLKADWKSAVHICYNKEQLLDAYSHIKGEKVILQEYVQKKNEYILQGISLKGGENVYIPIEGRYYRLPKDAYGTYLYFTETKNNCAVVESLQKIFRHIGYTGVFEVEFIEDQKGDLYFLEINFRHTLWNYTFTKMGVNLSTIWLESEIRGGELSAPSLSSWRKKKPFTLIREFTDYQLFVKTGVISKWQWIKDVITADSHVVFDWKDLRPYLMLIYDKIKRK